MNTTFTPAGTALSIGELAERSGLSIQTLRVWEQRYGFPEARRTDAGHRRYDVATTEQVLDVVRRRDAGLRLPVAIEQVRAGLAAPSAELPVPAPLRLSQRESSVYATLRREHPELPMQRLRKATLIGLSWAIEDEFCARAEHAHLFGAFEHRRTFEQARPRWDALAEIADSCHVYARFDGVRPYDTDGARRVDLGPRHPMRREWAVVCDSPEMPVVLAAWEVPGQDAHAGRDRIFEAVWSVDPVAVRTASKVCARVALDHDSPTAAGVLEDLDRPVRRSPLDPTGVARLLVRILGYVEEALDPRPPYATDVS